VGEWLLVGYRGATQITLQRVASNGQVVGDAVLIDGRRGFVYQDSVFQDLGLNITPTELPPQPLHG